jgi:hypothetical protein
MPRVQERATQSSWSRLVAGREPEDGLETTGASCTVLLHVTPPDGIGETDADFGVLPYFVQVNLDNLHELDGTITITDPGVSINVPEPATCALLGLGLAGIGLARGSRLRKERLLGAVRHPGVPAQRLVR